MVYFSIAYPLFSDREAALILVKSSYCATKFVEAAWVGMRIKT